ncbi:hypothetical protein [Erwinia pyrifoliae]|uniref:Uncharacterized protein n=1 Tax=Erwinia pyrifoliae TaxID=79967 RepID=A0ABY5XBJ2_ERWPY|nr:hypothetical protein [Erwinia pyrifoliae]UWS34572.1 hypothetical protein NYP84_05255 [Erwinia pyrifoliae]
MFEDFIFLTKICSKEKFADSFLDGELHMNTIDFFRKTEDKEDNNIADIHEGVSAWIQPNKVSLTLGFGNDELVLGPNDLAGPIIIKHDYYKYINVFCLTVLHSAGILGKRFTLDEFNEAKKNYQLDERLTNLGKYCIFIYNFDEFINRVKLAIKLHEEHIENCTWGPVNYFDETNSHFASDEISGVFKKRSCYSHQKEFRIAIQHKNQSELPFILRIGSIRDIAIKIPTSQFNKLIRLNLKNKEN